MTLKPIAFIWGPFDVPVQAYEVQSVLTNESPQTAYRGFGSAPHNLALAAVMHQAAQELGLSPGEIQRRNFIRPESFPYTTASGDQIARRRVASNTVRADHVHERAARRVGLRDSATRRPGRR